MRQHGVVTRWNDERGFGFITPTAGGSQVFVHVSELPTGPRPVVGTAVTYSAQTEDRGRLRATQVDCGGRPGQARRGRHGVGAAAALSVTFLAVVGALAAVKVLPIAALLATLLMSLVAVVLYRRDKSAALRGAWRTPESTLHVVSVLGGWPAR